MQFKIVIVLALMQIAAGDLIGWNRTRNTAHKHMMVRNKIGDSALVDQYRAFYRLQKLHSAVKKNIKKRSVDQVDDIEHSEKPKQQPKKKNGRLNRFRRFHA